MHITNGLFAPFLALVVVAGCYPGPDDPRQPFPQSGGEETSSAQVTVGFRLALDPEGEEESVRLVAVVLDADGEESVTDLGRYQGTVTEREPHADGLGHVAVDGDDEGLAFQLVQSEPGFIDVTRRRDGQEAEVIERIPVNESAPVRPSDPLVERPR